MKYGSGSLSLVRESGQRKAPLARLVTCFVMAAAVMLSLCACQGTGKPGDLPEPSGGGTTVTTAPPPDVPVLTVGSYFEYGSYPQTKNGEVKPINWRVLEVRGKRALMISEYVLDRKLYNEEYAPVMWVSCTLREWLNDDFIDIAFTEPERRRIITVTNENPDVGDVRGGKDTEDRVFCLSVPEAKKYFSGNVDRMAAPTPYALERGCAVKDELTSSGERAAWWWLRSPGEDNGNAAIIYNNCKTGVKLWYFRA